MGRIKGDGRRALILESDDLCGLVLEEFFLFIRWESEVVLREKEVYSALTRRMYDLLVVDHAVFGGPGLTVIRRVKTAYELPVFALTAVPYGLPLFRAGADVYFEKPFRMRDFLAAVLSYSY